MTFPPAGMNKQTPEFLENPEVSLTGDILPGKG
jgi:hypothetical protein